MSWFRGGDGDFTPPGPWFYLAWFYLCGIATGAAIWA